ncbi:sugar ABC transporter substrate-binding protein [Rhizobium rhizogenes]|uniref:Sugar ABC transporter n=1 Tax=Rhizobium rhizogenes TaxID=359 RepID=A0AA92BZV8_RHIRH|nr:sugar ABC transporter substrate-binding protein [Rhizobium rhizogenes]PVE50622.1 sugar ABC transporter [Rhizobium rhizogenes]PVE62377.1 sugar ABC transporter [Agrobacterium tumefaciens]PVE70560.1 sugar ABC transporter [Sphingomonas sp. TPD3009]
MKVRVAALVAASMLFGTHAMSAEIVGIITKTNTNPGFVKMREGAEEKAKELGLELRSFAGKFDGDNDGQVEAIENLVAAGAKGILITPSDTKAIVPAVQAAREAGVLVIALDTPLEPIDAADATFGTDNFKAGQLIGEWASKSLGTKAADAKIAFLDLAVSQPTVDYLRDQGFMKGFGIDIKDPNRYGDETDARICGHEMTGGAEDGGRTAMEKLLQKCSDINVVYTINEPSAAGAWEALKAVGKDDGSVVVVSIDGGCPGVKNVEAGVIGATSMQFLKNMGSIGVDALNKFITTGERPKPTPGLKFFDTGVKLITDKPVDGLESIDTKKGLQLCWG